MRAVLDTNVIVSGLNFPGNERTALDLARRGRFELYLSPFILQETVGVLAAKFGWEDDMTAHARDVLRGAATLIDPARLPNVIEANAADNRILECAVEASADYLVTGDRRHLLPLKQHMGLKILNAPTFLNTLET